MIMDDQRKLTDKVNHLENRLVAIEVRFEPIQRLVWYLVGTVLVSVLAAVLGMVIINGT